MKVQPRLNTIGLHAPRDPSLAAAGAAPKSARLAADDASGPPEFLKYTNRPPLAQGAGATESIEDCYAARKLLRELANGFPATNPNLPGDGPTSSGNPGQTPKGRNFNGPNPNPLSSTPLSTDGNLFPPTQSNDGNQNHGGPPDAFPKAIELTVEQPEFHHPKGS